jgi:hypothetical protein
MTNNAGCFAAAIVRKSPRHSIVVDHTEIQDGHAYQSLTADDQAKLWKICEERGYTHEVDVAGDGLCVGRACAPLRTIARRCAPLMPLLLVRRQVTGPQVHDQACRFAAALALASTWENVPRAQIVEARRAINLHVQDRDVKEYIMHITHGIMAWGVEELEKLNAVELMRALHRLCSGGLNMIEACKGTRRCIALARAFASDCL